MADEKKAKEVKGITRESLFEEVRKENPDKQEGWIGQEVDTRLQRARANGTAEAGQ